MKFFDDITIGDRRELGSHTFTAEEIKAFAPKYDPQPFHVDEEAAARSHFGRLMRVGLAHGGDLHASLREANQRDDEAMRAARRSRRQRTGLRPACATYAGTSRSIPATPSRSCPK